MIAAKALCRNSGGCLCTTGPEFKRHCIAQRLYGDRAAAAITALDRRGYIADPDKGFRSKVRRAWNRYLDYFDQPERVARIPRVSLAPPAPPRQLLPRPPRRDDADHGPLARGQRIAE